MRTKDRNCSGCRYWSEMIAKVHDTALMAMCLGEGRLKGKYTTEEQVCEAYAKNSHGAVDDPPDYGEAARASYAAEAEMKYDNGRPKFAPDGTMMNDQGTRSIFDDVDE
jgi:hypothetical protein